MSRVPCDAQNITIEMSVLHLKVTWRYACQIYFQLNQKSSGLRFAGNGIIYLPISQHCISIRRLETLHFVSLTNPWAMM